MNRFYKTVTIVDQQDAATPLWQIALDGRSVKTPGRATLEVPTEALAKTIAAEWDRQGEKVDAASMPMMRLACTTIDRVMTQRAMVEDEVVKYGGSDLICYPADVPEDLANLQVKEWQSWHDFAARDLDAPLALTHGISHVAQEESSLNALARHVKSLSDWQLMGVHSLTTVGGSLVLALAVAKGALDGDGLYRLAHLDEEFNLERWGSDKEAEARLAGRQQVLQEAASFLRLLES